MLEKLLKLLQKAGNLFYIAGPDTLPAPLSAEREAACLQDAEQGDKNAREQLISHNLRLVVFIARRFDSTGVDMEDLISIGTVGLIKAVETYKADKNIKLATYASRCIENEILMYIRKISNRKAEVSLDEPINTDYDGNELLLADVLGTEEDTVLRPLEDREDLVMLRQAVGRLPAREKDIVFMRFGLGGRKELTQKEVAGRLGISQSYISRIEKRILQSLKNDFLQNASCT